MLQQAALIEDGHWGQKVEGSVVKGTTPLGM